MLSTRSMSYVCAGISFPTDNDSNNPVSRAKKYLNHWREPKDLIMDYWGL